MARANIEITAQNKTKAAFDQAQQSIGKLDSAANKLRGGLAGLAGALGVGAFAGMISSAVTAADRLEKLSVRLGISTTALSQLQYVAERSGVSFDTMAMGLQRMQRRIAEAAATGKGEAVPALEELGLSAEKLSTLPLDKQFEVISDSLNGLANSGDKTRLAMKLFDSEGVALVQTMKEGSAGIQELRKQADGLGATLDQDSAKTFADLSDTWTNLTTAAGGLAKKIVEGLAPALKALSNIVTTAILEFGDLGNAIGAYAAAALEFFTGNLAGAKELLAAREKERAKIDETIAALWAQKDAQDAVNGASGVIAASAGPKAQTEDEFEAELDMVAGQFERLGLTADEGYKALAEIQRANRDQMAADEAEYWDMLHELDADNARAREQAMGDMWSNLTSLMNSGSRQLFEIGKAAATADAVVKTYQAAQNAFANAPWPYNYAAAAAALAAGFSRVSQIRGASFGGGGGGGGAVATTPASAPVTGQLPPPPAGSGSSSREASIVVSGGLFSDEDVRNIIKRIGDVSADMGGNVALTVN